MAKSSGLPTVSDVYSYIAGNQYVYFATTLDNQPKIRPMVLFFHQGRFFFITFTNDSKVTQIKRNKLCEVLLPIKDDGNTGYVKMTGKAKICQDLDARYDAQYFCYFFDDFYDGSNDPNFTLIELIFDCFEILKPGETHSVKVNI